MQGSVDRNVAIRYALEYTDRGLARAVATTTTLEKTSQRAGAQVVLSARRQQDAWRLLDRQARQFDTDTTRRSLSQASAVSDAVARQVAALRRLGASYKEIGSAMRASGAEASQAASAINRQAAVEEAAAARIARARSTLSRAGNFVIGRSGGGDGTGERETRSFFRGTVRGAVGRSAGFLGGGLVGGLAGFVGVEQIKSTIESTKELAKETQYLTQVTGMDAKTAAEWAAVAESRGVSASRLNVAIRTLSKGAESALTAMSKSVTTSHDTLAAKSAEALKGTKSEVDAFKALGISTKDVASRQHNMADLTDLVTSRLAKMRDGVQKTAVANTLLGKSGASASLTAQAFEKLGITQKDLQAHSHDLTGLLGLVADRLDRLPGGAEKAAIAAQLFGRNAAALWPLLNEGSKGMEEMRKKAEAYGVTLGKDPVSNIHKLEEASYDLKLAQIGLSVQFTEHVAPALIKVTEGGIKLATAIGHDVGPAFKALAPEVRDVGHWLGENKGVVIALAGALAGLKIVRTVGGWMGGLYNDGKRAADFLKGFYGLVTGQEREAAAVVASNDEIAASLERIAAASRAAAGGMEGLTVVEREQAAAGGAGGAGLILPAGVKGAKGVRTAEAAAKQEAGMAEGTAMTMTEGGILGTLFGRTGLQTLTTKIGAAGIGGLLGNQLGGLAGGLVGGKTGAGYGKAIGTGAGIGLAFGPEGAVAGAAIGAGLHALSSLGGKDSPADLANAAGEKLKDLTTQIQGAAKADNWTKVKRLGDQAQKIADDMRAGGRAIPQTWRNTIGSFDKLSKTADSISSGLRGQRAAGVIGGMLQQQNASRFSTTGIQLSTVEKSLNQLGGKYQQAGAKAALEFAAGLERNGRLPKGATDKLIAAIEAKYPSLSAYLHRQGLQSMDQLAAAIRVNKVTSTAKGLLDNLQKTFAWLPDYTHTAGKNAAAKLSSAEDELRNIMKNGTQAQKDAAAPILAQIVALHAKATGAIAAQTKANLDEARREVRALGGDWNSLGSVVQTVVGQEIVPSIGNAVNSVTNLLNVTSQLPTSVPGAGPSTVPVAPAPHKGGHFRGGGWVVPGDPTRDGTLAWLSGNEVVVTGGGQAMMDQTAPGLLDHVIAHQPPHFQSGGRVFRGAVSTFGPPGEAAGSTAYGGSDDRPGIAINPGPGQGDWNSTLAQSLKGKTFHVQVGSHTGNLPVIDKGPSALAASGPYAGRVRTIDVTGRGAQQMGFNVGAGGVGFPTDAAGTATELGAAAAAQTKANSSGSKDRSFFTFGPRGKRLVGGFDLGYQYALDPTGGGTGPAGALRQAITGASMKATKHTTSSLSIPKGAVAVIPSGSGSSRAMQVQTSMLNAAGQIVGRPYVYGGGHGSFSSDGYDCSGAVSYVLHAGGFMSSPESTDGLKVWGLPGPGKYISVGVRGTTGMNAHTMMSMFGRYFESGGSNGQGPHWDSGWDGSFPIIRHPAGYRKGGRVRVDPYVSRRYGIRSGDPRLQPGSPGFLGYGLRRGGRIPRFRAGGPVSTNQTQTGLASLFQSRDAQAQSAGAAGGGGGMWPAAGYSQLSTLHQVLAQIPVQAVSYGVHTATAAAKKLAAGIRQLAGAADSTAGNAAVSHALTEISTAVGNVHRLSYHKLRETAAQLQREIHKVGTSTPAARNETRRLQQALQLVDHQMGVRVGTIVKVAEDQADALQSGQNRLQRLLDRKGIDSATAQGASMLEAFDTQSVKVLKSTVSRLRWALKAAKKAGDNKAVADITGKLKDALDQLDQAVTDKITEHRAKVEAAAQAVVDSATHASTMAQAGEQDFELKQQLAGTFGTPGGAQAQAAYINQNVVPSLQKELVALQAQQAAAQSVGDSTLATQIAEAIASKQSDIDQAKVNALQAIQQSTQQTAQALEQMGADEGVTLGGQTFPDFAGLLNGA